MQRFALRPLRRSSSRIQRWVQDQQKRNSSGDTDGAPDSQSACDTPDAASGCHPWLAYPHLTVRRSTEDNADVVNLDDDDFVFVDEHTTDAPVTEVGSCHL